MAPDFCFELVWCTGTSGTTASLGAAILQETENKGEAWSQRIFRLDLDIDQRIAYIE